MRLGFFSALLLVTYIGCSSNLVHAEKTDLEADSVHTTILSESSKRNLLRRTLRAEAEDTTIDAGDEDRGLEVINRLKAFIQKSAQNVKMFQKSPAAIKEVENLKNTPVVAQSLNKVKQNPGMMQQINKLNQHPEVLTALQNRPLAQSISKVEQFITKGQTRGTTSEGPGFLVSFILIMGGFMATLLLVNYFTQG